MTHTVHDIAAEEEGQALVEYALILSLVMLVGLVGLRALSTSLGELINSVAAAITGAS